MDNHLKFFPKVVDIDSYSLQSEFHNFVSHVAFLRRNMRV
uniref:Uncharacterized protein n=1 Tax=Lepeophtheirus salmonis TaxID=72036 RepID=A0A0K2SYS4_LEPSM